MAKSSTAPAAQTGPDTYDDQYLGTLSSGISEPQSLKDADPDGDGIADNGKAIFTTEQAAAQLTRDSGGGWKVGPIGQITYAFLDHAPSGQYNTKAGDAFAGLRSYAQGFAPFTEAQREAAREAIQLWDDLIAPTFVEKNGGGAADIVYMNTSTGPAQAAAFVPWGNTYVGYHPKYHKFDKLQGDTFVNQDQADNFDLALAGYGQTTLIHETGHAIGLSHPGDYNFAVGGVITYSHDASYFQDSYQYSIMSYFNAGNTGAVGFVNWATGGYYQTPQMPMIQDIAAVQSLYGADLTTRTGDTTYGFHSNADRDVFDFNTNVNPFITIYDAGGHDTLDMSGFARASVLDLREGHFSTGWGQEVNAAQLNKLYGIEAPQALWDALFEGRTGDPGFLTDNIGIALDTVIEDGVTGAGEDTLIGNSAANRLDGGASDDKYTGDLGGDTFVISQEGFTDTITDFGTGADKLDLRAFHITAANVKISADGRTLTADVDGNGSTDLTVISQFGAISTADILFV